MRTETVKINKELPLEPQLCRAAEVIRGGGLVAFPTETVYGLGANGLDEKAAAAIYAAKGRPSDNPLILHIDEPTKAEKYAYTCEAYYALARKFMPGPLTVIMPKRDIVPMATTGGLETVALRCPENRIARELIRLCDLPIAAPSANISGKPSPTCAAHVLHDMDRRIDMVIDGGECDIGVESTIVELAGGKATLLRPGAITLDMLREVLGEVSEDPTITHIPEVGMRPKAPGMKYRHYAPSAPTVLICDDGTADFDMRAIKFLSAKKAEDKKTGILCFEEYIPELAGKYTVSLGEKSDESEHARRLFAALRHFDDLGADRIYATDSSTGDVGLAFYNRMLKASGYNIEKV